uniref:Uncharacterized protein n=1 Tax=Rhizobium rhizogenes TaxID=359 RepID=A0A7S4ZSR8_RHIRH|nr:hypothetical protein pC5.7c_612 [Rhizobium rhizogenes]QCL09962.1 hypothetical protein pC5.8b_472 [Rhizobium rhizogenes]
MACLQIPIMIALIAINHIAINSATGSAVRKGHGPKQGQE